MKRIAILVAAALSAAAATAAETTGEQAKLAVAGWERIGAALGGEITAAPESAREYPAKGGNGKFFVVSLAGGGFVVVSGDTALNPVLAYSKEGEWVDDVSRNPLLAMLPIDVAAAMEDAAAVQANVQPAGSGRASAGAAAGGNAAKWAKLLAAGMAGGGRASAGAGKITSADDISDLRVGALLTTAWNQRYNGENLYTPGKYVCGCVATAGSQVMFYHKWPRNTEPLVPYKALSGGAGAGDWTLAVDGSGGWRLSPDAEYTPWDPAFGGPYDWEAMANGGTTAKQQAIGRLTRDVGLASKMAYGSGGSGAYSTALLGALKEQFGYTANLQAHASETGNRSWKTVFITNFDAHLPVIVEVPGHEIVGDGYGYQDGTFYVHFNLGWGGLHNAWYAAPDLTQADAAFNSILEVIYNVVPASQGLKGRSIVSGRLLSASGQSIGDGSTVVAKNASTGVEYSTQTTNGIYALHLPAGTYSIGSTGGAELAVATNLTVRACVDTWNEYGASIGTGWSGGSVGNVSGVELQYGQVAAPAIASGADNGAFHGATLKVAISSAAEGAEIRYTLDGTDPTPESALYGGPFELSGSATVKACLVTGGMFCGPVASATFAYSPYWSGKYADTGANRAAHWVEETAATHNATGSWAGDEGFGADGVMRLDDMGVFSAAAAPKSSKIEIRMKATADSICAPLPLGIEDSARAAVRICGENGVNRFQALTRVDGVPAWVDLVGKTPQTGVEYGIKISLNAAAKTWTAAVAEGGVETRLAGAAGGAFESGVFPFANDVPGAVGRFAVAGDGAIESLEGSYSQRRGFFMKVE